MTNSFSYSSNKENLSLSINKNHIYDSFTKIKAPNSNQTTVETNKCISVLDHIPTEFGKVLSYGKSLKSRDTWKTHINQMNQITPKIQNPFIKIKESDSNKEFSHEFIPREMLNNEAYKTLLCKKVFKHPRFKTNKTFTKEDFITLDHSDRLQKDFTSLIKRTKISSTKVLYTGQFQLSTNDKKMVTFKFYRDEDIGMDEEWQKFIIESRVDEDVETDEETLEKLDQIVFNDLLEGINELKNSKFSPDFLLHNYRGN
jgi:hypothetical protein